MKYDFDKAMPVNTTVEFFQKYAFEVIGCCMRLQPNTNGLSKEDAISIRFKAMDMVAKIHEFGKFRHLCKTCDKHFTDCDGDPMFNDEKDSDNVCVCLQYKGSIPPETVSKGLSEVDVPTPIKFIKDEICKVCDDVLVEHPIIPGSDGTGGYGLCCETCGKSKKEN